MSNEIKYFSMFTGVGGFELGLDNSWNINGSNRKTGKFERVYPESKKSESGFKCVGFSEIDKYASQLLAAKFPNIRNYGDATKINTNELPDFDMLCGGFPCQAFSIAGKRRGFEESRGTLFFEIARIIKVKRPKIVFLENVKGLLNHNKGETFQVIIQTLSELGYDVQWMVLNSKFFGVPQNRERVFIIGNLRGTPRPEILPFATSSRQTSSMENLREASTKTLCARGQSDMHSSLQLIGQPIKTIPVLTPSREEKRQNGRRFKEDGDESFTLTKTDIHGVYDGMKIRRLTPIECERLQGFPDNWTQGFSDSQRYKMMGNAVTVNVIRAIAEKLL